MMDTTSAVAVALQTIARRHEKGKALAATKINTTRDTWLTSSTIVFKEWVVADAESKPVPIKQIAGTKRGDEMSFPAPSGV